MNLRSAVSIARRMQDPLAELVKIDPKAIGVGQYQHDMPQKRLDETLGGVVEDCVNAVGVDVNTASASLLGRVSGLNAATAKKYCEIPGGKRRLHRPPPAAEGAQAGTQGLPAVAGLPAGAGEQVCAGQHRRPSGSYAAAEGLLALCGYTVEVSAGRLADLPQKVKALGWGEAAARLDIGVPTLRDVAAELVKPGRDVRDELPAPILRTDVLDIRT